MTPSHNRKFEWPEVWPLGLSEFASVIPYLEQVLVVTIKRLAA